MNYRPEIDGLRALAVLPVVFFHLGWSIFDGGYIGVDIFFVISGYLIATLIIKEIEDESFSLINFYYPKIFHYRVSEKNYQNMILHRLSNDKVF